MAFVKMAEVLKPFLIVCIVQLSGDQGKINGMTISSATSSQTSSVGRSAIAGSQDSILYECRVPPLDHWWPCGEGQCKCQQRMAYCSDDYGQTRRYIPAVPHTTRTLCFGRNFLKSVSSADFFKNVTGISGLDLSNNFLVYLNPSAFQLVKNLKVLSVAGNDKLSVSDLSVVFSVRTLEQLNLSDCNLARLPRDAVYNVTALSRLRTLILQSNNFETMNLTSFSFLTSLQILVMNYNKLSEIYVHSVLSVEELNLTSNNLFDFLDTCDQNNVSLFPNLKRLSVRDNHMHSLPKILCLPSLQVLDIGGNEWQFVLENYFSGFRFPHLEHLDLSKSYTILTLPKSTFFNLTSLKFLTLEEVWNSFEKCAHVSSLNLFANSFTDFHPSVSFKGQGLKSLKQLNVGSCHISDVKALNICHFEDLADLDLSSNSISHIPEGAFDCLLHLKSLRLSWNQITVISPDTFNAVMRHRLQLLDLSMNELHCSCELLWFQNWLKTSTSLFYFGSTYMCYNIHNVTVAQVVLLEQPCLLDQSTYVSMVCVLSLLITLFFLILMTSRYRWHFRLLLYEACRGRGDARRIRLQAGNFDYDVFVSYDMDNLLWVRQHLVPQLEDHLGLRLCLHQRDFIPGRPIIENIVSCVEASKKVLMVFSVNFARSRWCQFELAYCLQHVMDYDDDLIIVCVDDVTSREMTAAMMGVLRTTTYIAWKPRNDDAISSFWRRVQISLQDIL